MESTIAMSGAPRNWLMNKMKSAPFGPENVSFLLIQSVSNPPKKAPATPARIGFQNK